MDVGYAHTTSRPVRRCGGFREFVVDERGQAATEYILIIGLFVVPLAIAFNSLQGVLKDMLKDIARLLSGPGV
jgi:Flp pilus assembly pilin Flp